MLFIRILLCFIFISVYNTGHSQTSFNHLLHQSYNYRFGVLEKIRMTEMGNAKDTSLFRQKINTIEKLAKDSGDIALNLEARFLQASYNWFLYSKDSANNINTFLDLLQLIDKHQYKKLEARVHLFLGQYYWENFGDYELAMEYLWKTENIVNSIDDTDYYDKATCLYLVGDKYYYFSDYEKAIQTLRNAVTVPEQEINANYYNGAINAIGLSFQQLGQLDSANKYFNLLINKEYKHGAAVWRDIATGNVGYGYYLQKNYDKAYSLLLHDFETAVDRNDPHCASGSGIYLSDIYVRRNQLEKAEQQIALAKKYIHESEKLERYAFLYPVIAQWYAQKGDKEKARAYVDSTSAAIEHYYTKYNAVQLHKAGQRINLMEREAEKMTFEQKRLKDINRRNIIISILAFVTVLAAGAWFFQKRKAAEKIRLQKLKYQQAQDALIQSKKRLDEFAQSIAEKNTLIEALQEKYLTADKDSEAILAELRNSVILTDQDWAQFQAMFEKARPGFILALQLKYPDLSEADVRYILLSNIKLSHKEMASVLGISTDSLRVTWHRLRKKLAIPSSSTIQDFLNEVENEAFISSVQ